MEKREVLIQERFNQMDEIAERTGFDACLLMESYRGYSTRQLWFLTKCYEIIGNPHGSRYESLTNALKAYGKEAA